MPFHAELAQRVCAALAAGRGDEAGQGGGTTRSASPRLAIASLGATRESSGIERQGRFSALDSYRDGSTGAPPQVDRGHEERHRQREQDQVSKYRQHQTLCGDNDYILRHGAGKASLWFAGWRGAPFLRLDEMKVDRDPHE